METHAFHRYPAVTVPSPRLFNSSTLLFRDNQEEDDEPIPDELLREGEREQQEQEKTAGIDEEREKNSIEGEDRMSGKGENSMEFGANLKELEAKIKRAAKRQEKLAEIGQEMDANSREMDEQRAAILSKLQQSIRELRELDEDAKSDESPDDSLASASQPSNASNSTSTFNAASSAADSASSDELRERHTH